MNITIIGGGNLGSLIAANLSLVSDVIVTIWTTKPEKFTGKLLVHDREKGIEYLSSEIMVTSQAETAVSDADVIFCTVPAFLYEFFILQLVPYVKKGALLGFVPASGGVEFMCKELMSDSVNIFGLQRAPYICRNIEYGEICGCESTKNMLFVASIPLSTTQLICDLMKHLFKIPCTALHNFLEATLVPSNAILHTSRLYEMFHLSGYSYTNNPLFYYEWNDEASELLLLCDNELQIVCKSFGELNLSGVVSLKEYYGVDTSTQLTAKMKSIPAFRKIFSPMVERSPGQWEPDWQSRYFTEDFPYGLAVIKGFANIAEVHTPIIDDILQWYQNTNKKEYFSPHGQPGKDIDQCGAPQRYGFEQKSQIILLYS
jgi:hypothetical protein